MNNSIFYTATELTFTASPNANSDSIGTLSGYALIWDTDSSDRGGYVVKLAPNSATFENPTLALWSHDRAAPLGTTANGSLRYSADAKGIKVDIDLPNTQLGRDTKELVDKKYVQGMSFQMVNPTFEKQKDGEKKTLYATKYGVSEVTITADPAFTQTSIGLKYEDVITAEELKIAEENTIKENRHKEYRKELAKLEQLKLNALNLAS